MTHRAEASPLIAVASWLCKISLTRNRHPNCLEDGAKEDQQDASAIFVGVVNIAQISAGKRPKLILIVAP